jgi:hypothetical protein
MVNTRGNTYSKGHRYYRTTDAQYWQYSMDELALIDLPTQIDFILQRTGQPSLGLIGHSQGGTLPLMLAAAKPEYNDKIWLFGSMGSVVFAELVKAPYLIEAARLHSTNVSRGRGMGGWVGGWVGVGGGRAAAGSRATATRARGAAGRQRGAARCGAALTPPPPLHPPPPPAPIPAPLQILAWADVGQFLPSTVSTQLIKSCRTPTNTPYCYDLVCFLFYGPSERISNYDFELVGTTWPATVAVRNLEHWWVVRVAGAGGGGPRPRRPPRLRQPLPAPAAAAALADGRPSAPGRSRPHPARAGPSSGATRAGCR